MQVPKEFLFNYEKGTELLHQRRFKEALPYLEKALTYLRHPTLLINLSTVLKENGDFAQARELLLEAYDKVQETETEIRGMICYNMGNNLREEGKENESIRWYKEAISLRKNLAKQHFNLGQAYFATGDYDRALEQYDYILMHINSNDPDALRQKEIIKQAKMNGIKPSAHKEYQKKPPYKWKDYLADQHFMKAIKLRLADASLMKVKHELEEVLRREPENDHAGFWAVACNTYATIAIEGQDIDLASKSVEMGEMALKLHDQGYYLNDDILYVLYEGLTAGYFLVEEYEEAERYCKRALNIEPDSERMNNMLVIIKKVQKL